jgi:hypothetical protein
MFLRFKKWFLLCVILCNTCRYKSEEGLKFRRLNERFLSTLSYDILIDSPS